MTLKIGDIINHKRLGLMVLIDCDQKEIFDSRYKGQRIFKMNKLIDDSDTTWILRHYDLEDVKLATDDDIIDALQYRVNQESLNGTLTFNYWPEDACISISDTDVNNYVHLDTEGIKRLKELLEEINL